MPAGSRRTAAPDVSRLFHEQLLDNMHASVIFVDRDLTILKWSRDCEALTGLVASGVEGIRWDPSLIQMRDENYTLIPDRALPADHGDPHRGAVSACDWS